ncbi:MFS transporter [Phytohalomonas tamaricis]|uniref:MFS transporter n=1 Tax=Phytohalomonas tamaricis TaxID=2081032 RepID=UPI000D0BDB42|nr:MFS transporter [Phytohalomonas tamaricis]
MRSRRFAPFFWTQAFGAFNDNVYKNVLLLLITFVAVPDRGWDAGTINNLAAGLFILPFLLFSALGGTLADNMDKRQLICRLKWLELATMSVAALALWWQAYGLLLALLFMMGTQSALFGPVKYAILPQHLARNELVMANAWVEMGTFLAILLGTLLAAMLASMKGSVGYTLIGITLVGIAVCGLTASYFVPSAPATQHDRISWRPLSETWLVMRDAWRAKQIFPALLGISAFWFLGACYLTQLPIWTRDVVSGGEEAFSLLLAAFALGIGIGSFICARLSAGRLEIGLIPIGALLIAIGGLDFAHHSPLAASQLSIMELLNMAHLWWMLADLVVIGVGGGIYIVPLYTLVQLRSHEQQRARMIAANNLLNSLFMIVAALFGIVMLGLFSVSLTAFFVTLSVIALMIAVGMAVRQPRPLMRIIIFLLIHCWYRLRLSGRRNIPDEGAALVVCNHVSFMDALVLGGACSRPLRFLMDKPIYDSPWMNWFFRMAGAIPVNSERRDPVGMRRALDQVGQALENGEVVMIFPEGRLTRDGEVNEFRRGIEMVLQRNPVPVVPAALSGLWGSWTSRRDGKPFSRWPKRLRAKVSLTFGVPLSPEQATRETLELRVRELKAHIEGSSEKVLT